MGDLSMKGALGLLSNYFKARDASNEAEALTDKMPGWSNNGFGDAARHAIAAGLIARRINPETALTAGSLHEMLIPNESSRETDMDDRNNRFAAEMAPAFPTDQAYIDYVMGMPGQRQPQDLGPGALMWYGRPKSSEKASGGLVQASQCSCQHKAEGGLVSHDELYRRRAQGDQSVAPQEHRAFAREWTQENPYLAVPSLLAAIPLYSAAKRLGVIRARTPGSLNEMAEAYRGVGEGLGLDKLWND